MIRPRLFRVTTAGYALAGMIGGPPQWVLYLPVEVEGQCIYHFVSQRQAVEWLVVMMNRTIAAYDIRIEYDDLAWGGGWMVYDAARERWRGASTYWEAFREGVKLGARRLHG